MSNDNYNRWLAHNEPIPPRCRTWIENASGYCYPVHSRREGQRLVREWNLASANSRNSREYYNLHGR